MGTQHGLRVTGQSDGAAALPGRVIPDWAAVNKRAVGIAATGVASCCYAPCRVITARLRSHTQSRRPAVSQPPTTATSSIDRPATGQADIAHVREIVVTLADSCTLTRLRSGNLCRRHLSPPRILACECRSRAPWHATPCNGIVIGRGMLCVQSGCGAQGGVRAVLSFSG